MPFSSDTGTSRTDRQTDGRIDRIAISIGLSRVSVLTRDKNDSLQDMATVTTEDE